MSNKQGNCIGEASVILPITNAITSISHCDSMLITVPSFFKLKKACKYGNDRTLVYRGKCTVTNLVCDYHNHPIVVLIPDCWLVWIPGCTQAVTWNGDC